ncbi:MAG: hypothetical protein QXX77_08065 [Candidatus Methanosuratincola sp.]
MTYKIAVLRYAYQPDTGGLERVYFLDEEFETVEEAKEFIAELDNEVYILQHNEYSRPDYLVVDDVTADWIMSGRNSDLSNYDWSDTECTCGECSKCIVTIIDQDRAYVRKYAIS